MSTNGSATEVMQADLTPAIHEQQVAQLNATFSTTVKRSASIGKLVQALTKAQLEFTAVVKDAENPAYSRGTKKSMYATLDSVIGATRTPLAKNALAIIAIPQEIVDDRRLKITSILVHESDQFIESTLTMTAVEKVTPQELGKLITYARRYQWTSLTGTAPEDDTDGNESSGVGSKEAQQAVATRKIAEHNATHSGKEIVGGIEFVPDSAGMIQMRGNSDVAVLRANMPQPLLDLMVFLPNAKCWAVPVENGMQIFTLAQSHKIDCHISNDNFKKLEQMAELIATAEKKR